MIFRLALIIVAMISLAIAFMAATEPQRQCELHHSRETCFAALN